MFEYFDQATIAAGHVGGKASTPEKAAAARRNAKLGGRKPTRTLTERLLNRRIVPAQHKYIAQALGQLLQSELQQLEDFFGVTNVAGEAPMHTVLWRTKSRRIPKHIRYIIMKFKLAANHFLKDAPAPKDYLVESQLRTEAEQDWWEQLHPGIPCPPRRVRVYLRNLPSFSYFQSLYARGTNLTVQTIMSSGGSQWTAKRAEATLALFQSSRQ